MLFTCNIFQIILMFVKLYHEKISEGMRCKTCIIRRPSHFTASSLMSGGQRGSWSMWTASPELREPWSTSRLTWNMGISLYSVFFLTENTCAWNLQEGLSSGKFFHYNFFNCSFLCNKIWYTFSNFQKNNISWFKCFFCFN